MISIEITLTFYGAQNFLYNSLTSSFIIANVMFNRFIRTRILDTSTISPKGLFVRPIQILCVYSLEKEGLIECSAGDGNMYIFNLNGVSVSLH